MSKRMDGAVARQTEAKELELYVGFAECPSADQLNRTKLVPLSHAVQAATDLQTWLTR